MELMQPTGVSLDDSEVAFAVAFFGDRAVKIEDVGRVPTYVQKLISRFKRRIEAQRTHARPSR